MLGFGGIHFKRTVVLRLLQWHVFACVPAFFLFEIQVIYVNQNQGQREFPGQP